MIADRESCRKYRRSLLKEQTAELNRLQKVLEGANIKLSGTVREINGKSGRNFLETLLTGEKIDMAKITEMRRDKLIASDLKATDEQLIDDLNGVLSALQKKMLRTMLTNYYCRKIGKSHSGAGIPCCGK